MNWLHWFHRVPQRGGQRKFVSLAHWEQIKRHSLAVQVKSCKWSPSLHLAHKGELIKEDHNLDNLISSKLIWKLQAHLLHYIWCNCKTLWLHRNYEHQKQTFAATRTVSFQYHNCVIKRPIHTLASGATLLQTFLLIPFHKPIQCSAQTSRNEI